MRAGEANPFDARNGVNRFEQCREVAGRIVRRLVVIDDLSEQLHFAAAAVGGLPHVGEDLRFRSHALVPPRVRDDTEGAKVIAALDDGDVGAHRIAAPHHAQRE
jgi:hypothetical protein